MRNEEERGMGREKGKGGKGRGRGGREEGRGRRVEVGHTRRGGSRKGFHMENKEGWRGEEGRR